MNYGAVDVAVYTSNAFQAYSGGIYEDANTSCNGTNSDHAVALIGWDDNPPEGGGGCWILRNSWGTSWGEDGYMRIRYTSAYVACDVAYLTYEHTPPSAKKIYFLNIGSNGTEETEVCIINTSTGQSLSGAFKAYNDRGEHVSQDIDVVLPPHA